jgi:tetratricopeptide (TPR) repeat protein
MKKLQNVLFIALAILILSGCQATPPSQAMPVIDEYINGFARFIDLGDEYTEQGLQIQASYAYSWAGAALSSMRYSVDCLLYLRGEGNSLEEISQGRMSSWEGIAKVNYGCPYPWFFEGLVQHVQGNEEDALALYQMAMLNPVFDAENNQPLLSLGELNVSELKTIKAKLIDLEDSLYEMFEPPINDYPRSEYAFDDVHLVLLGRTALDRNPEDYRGALRHFKAALAVNPFEGDYFAACALMNFYLNDPDLMYFYVNEGLFVDPNHLGLQELAEAMNRGDTP